MYRILIAGPDGPYPGTQINVNEETAAFYDSDRAKCFSSLVPEDLDRCDGVIVPGGYPDVGPGLYGQEDTGCSIVDHDMDRRQMAMIKRSVEMRRPMIGFCRGLQLVTVFFGGSLIQDIPCRNFHTGNACFHETHSIPGTFMHELYGERMTTNSKHHQAIGRLPECFGVSQLWCSKGADLASYEAEAFEGNLRGSNEECIIEAVYHRDYPFVGLQWHPEFAGDLSCSHLDLTKIRDYFYWMMEQARSSADS